MTSAIPINRRSLLASVGALGGSLVLGFAAPLDPGTAQASGAGAEITAWIVIRPDDTVIIRLAKSEMGQGVMTALPMLVAEELECDWTKVRAEMVAPQENMARRRVWGDMSTGGSRSVRSSQQRLREAGATAREMLIAAAAAQWNVATSECRARNSVITHERTGRSLSFGQVAAAAVHVPAPQNIKLKPAREWRLIGTPQKRLDVRAKVLGEPMFGIDVRVPGMLYAAVCQCPVFGGHFKSADDAKATGMTGVRAVVKLDRAVAVVAEDWWCANKALERIDVQWDAGENGSISSENIKGVLNQGLDSQGAGVGRKEGDFAAAIGEADQRIEAIYEVPFLAHATLEPQNATAHVRGDEVEVWAPTQNGEAALRAAAEAAGVPVGNVKLHVTMLGGGFGRRGYTQDFVSLAVQIAKHVSSPVKVLWAREEDMRHDFYRPAAMAKMTAGLDATGEPMAWHVRLSGPSVIGFLPPGHVDRQFQEGFLQDMPYDVPNYLVEHAPVRTHVPVGFWRCVNHTQNCFFKESFIDELALAAQEDPYQYRRKLIRNHPQAEKFLAVLDAAAEKSDWETPPRAGVYRGLALNQIYDTYTAAVIEVSVSQAGELRVLRVVSAIDCGAVVNPLTVEMQVESATVFALTAAIHGEITISDGRVEQSNFKDYAMLRLGEMPQVETVIVRGDGPWSGVGEPPVAVVAPALCNAIFASTGKRIRSLPVKNHLRHS
jgi:isoquinoline 1-oxidoreductase beta subunit